MVPSTFSLDPSSYRHWKVSYDGEICRLLMNVQEDAPLVPGYLLKLNSYDLGVDQELNDFLIRLPFEHPEVRCVVVGSAKDRVFCAGANIRMLAASSHPFKVNFCKFTNETRLWMEELSAHWGVRFLAALNGVCAGGGYELALACDEIALVDDGASAVSLPEVPLLAVLPGTGGLTRVVDKRRVRRDRADVFSTLAEGIKGQRAVDWQLVDHVAPRSQFDELVATRAAELVEEAAEDHPRPKTPAVELLSVEPKIDGETLRYRHVTLTFDRPRHQATLTVRGPEGAQPHDLEAICAAGSTWWPLDAFRELEDAIHRLRFHAEDVNVVSIRTLGSIEAVLAADALVVEHEAHPFVHAVRMTMARVLRRLDLTARSFFAVVDGGSCFAGSLLELALAADRTYMLDAKGVSMAISRLNFGWLPMSHGVARLYLRTPSGDAMDELERRRGERLSAAESDAEGLVTVLADELDFDDELRVSLEERASLSPDALTGMEASLRFVGQESAETKIFGRLSAWQNWIFTRPNSTGPTGALTRYGSPEKAVFDFRRT